VLGICRGVQVLAVAAGGALVQEVVREGAHAAQPGSAEELLEGRHRVDLEPGSHLANVLGVLAVDVNSIHHQAVADPGDLAIVGRSEHVVEAVEARGGWHAVGVQWHPEKMAEPVQRALFADLVDAAGRAGRGASGVTPAAVALPRRPAAVSEGQAGSSSA